MKNQSLLTIVLFLVTLTLNGQDCTQSAEVQDARSKMSAGDNGLMCGQVAQYYALKCQCEKGLPTQEAASQLAKQINAAAKAYNDYGMPCAGYSKLSSVGSCKVGTSGSSGSTKKTFSNTVIFSDAELGQLEQMAKESGNENWIYRVKTMKEFHETAKMAKALAPGNKQLTAMENAGQIFNLFMAPLKKKLEEEEAKEKARETEIMDAYNYSEEKKADARFKENVVQYLILYKYFILYRANRLNYLYTGESPDQRDDQFVNLITRYQEYPIYDTLLQIPDNVFSFLAAQELQKKAALKMMDVVGKDNATSAILGSSSYSDIYKEEDIKTLLSRSKYSKTFREIVGIENPIATIDLMLEIKNSLLNNKDEELIQLIKPIIRLDRGEFCSSYSLLIKDGSNWKQPRVLKTNNQNFVQPSIYQTFLNAVSEENLATAEELLGDKLMDQNPYEQLNIDFNGKAPKVAKTIKNYGDTDLLNAIAIDVSTLLYQNTLLLRKGAVEQVITNYNSFLDRLKFVTQTELSDSEGFLKVFGLFYDPFFEDNVYAEPAVELLDWMNELTLTCVDAHLANGNKDAAKKLIEEYLDPSQLQLAQSVNISRLTLGGFFNQINKRKNQGLIPINEHTPVPVNRTLYSIRHEYYRDLLGLQQPAGSSGKFLVIHDLDRTHYDISDFLEFYGLK